MPDHNQYGTVERGSPPVSVSHLVRTLGAYLPVIALTMLAVIVGYAIVAAAFYLLAPSQRVTTLPFRLEFQGAENGEYPNGTKFSGAEIVSTPIILRVYNQNQLNRFVRFNDFAGSLFVLVSNKEQEQLAQEYQARLSDPKLTAIDRERLQREYQLKAESLSKSQYSLNYVASGPTARIPETMVRKVLNDVLTEWANFVSAEQHVLEYRVNVLSPDIITITSDNPVIAAEVLRKNVLRIVSNITEIQRIAPVELIRSKDGLSLMDIAFRLDEIVRFRLEPLVHRIAAAGLDNRTETLRFLESQLAYDERLLDSQQRTAMAIEQTLSIYQNGRLRDTAAAIESSTVAPPAGAGQETVMPQISDSFLERLIQLTSRAQDTEYRQKLADDFHMASLGIVPLQQAVAYDRSTLEVVRKASGGDGLTRAAVDQQLNATHAEVRRLLVKVHELHRMLSGSLNPTKELMAMGTITTRVERGLSIKRLALYGILTALLALPIIVILCLLHNRLREEEEEEELVARDVVETAV